MNIFVWKLPKIAAQKKFFFFTFFGLLWFSVFFNGLFDPTSRSRMSNIFRYSESLGKSNGKKWSNIWTFLLGSGLRLPHKKKFFFLVILLWSTLLWHRCYYPHRSRDALSPVCGIFSLRQNRLKENFLLISNVKKAFLGFKKNRRREPLNRCHRQFYNLKCLLKIQKEFFCATCL